MDSKLKRFCIMGSLAMIVLVVLLVLYENRAKEINTIIVNENIPASEELLSETRTEKGLQLGYSLNAFEEDADFFDPGEKVVDIPAEKSLSMVVTSVEKDLRVLVVNGKGDVVSGESFSVSIENQGEYKDADKNGVIYIGNMSAGEYKLALMPIKDYSVPQEYIRVAVKDKVEYIAIKDISLLMKTEADIDAEAEDANLNDALDDADKSEITKLQKGTTDTSVGIDVSKWNKDIDWDKVKNAGVEFAIIRAGYRGYVTGALVVDPYFEQNMRGATNSNVETGVYFFTQAINEVEAVEEASMVVRLLQDYDIQYPVFIDTEGVGGNGRADNLDVETRTRICEAFCETIRNEGYQAGVYASRNWYNNKLETSRLEKYFIWLAEYRKEPLYQGNYQMWQYTSKGIIDGIEGNVDMNVMSIK